MCHSVDVQQKSNRGKKEVQLQPCVHLQLGCDQGACLKGLSNSPPKKYMCSNKNSKLLTLLSHRQSSSVALEVYTDFVYKWSSWSLQPISGLSHHMLFHWHHQSHRIVVFLIEPLRPLIGLQRSYADHRSLGITVSGRIEWHVTAEPTDCLQVVSPWPVAKD